MDWLLLLVWLGINVVAVTTGDSAAIGDDMLWTGGGRTTTRGVIVVVVEWDKKEERERERGSGGVYIRYATFNTNTLYNTHPTHQESKPKSELRDDEQDCNPNEPGQHNNPVAANPKEKSPLWLKFMEGGEFTATV